MANELAYIVGVLLLLSVFGGVLHGDGGALAPLGRAIMRVTAIPLVLVALGVSAWVWFNVAA